MARANTTQTASGRQATAEHGSAVHEPSNDESRSNSISWSGWLTMRYGIDLLNACPSRRVRSSAQLSLQ